MNCAVEVAEAAVAERLVVVHRRIVLVQIDRRVVFRALDIAVPLVPDPQVGADAVREL